MSTMTFSTPGQPYRQVEKGPEMDPGWPHSVLTRKENATFAGIVRDIGGIANEGFNVATEVQQETERPNPFRPFEELQKLLSYDEDGRVGAKPNVMMSASGGEQYSNAFFPRDTLTSMDFLWQSLPEDKRNFRELLAASGVSREDMQSPDFDYDKAFGKAPVQDRYALKIHYMVRELFKTMVKYQGTRDPYENDETDAYRDVGESEAATTTLQRTCEEPGKIHHEMRRRRKSDADAPARDEIFDRLNDLWGENNPEYPDLLVMYQNIDSTPRFVALLTEYIRAGGNYDLLDERVEHYRGESRSIREGLRDALGWIEKKLEVSTTGFLEYVRGTGQQDAIRNQVWKDSLTSFVHENSELANTNAAIAPAEEQALVFDALRNAEDLFGDHQSLAAELGVDESKPAEWGRKARALQRNFVDTFWLSEERRFAQGIDHEPDTGESRKIKTATSDQFHLLKSRILKELPEDEQRRYVTALVEQLFDPKAGFISSVGVLCRSAIYARNGHPLVSFADYHGDSVSWPKESVEIAMGLSSWGFKQLAKDLALRVMNLATVSGDGLEFTLVDPATGKVYPKYIKKKSLPSGQSTEAPVFVSTNGKEKNQAWTLAGVTYLKRMLGGALKPEESQPWAKGLDEKVYRNLEPKAVALKWRKDILMAHGSTPVAVVDTEEAMSREAAYRRSVTRPGETSRIPHVA